MLVTSDNSIAREKLNELNQYNVRNVTAIYAINKLIIYVYSSSIVLKIICLKLH